jgi:hypothetical protein
VDTARNWKRSARASLVGAVPVSTGTYANSYLISPATVALRGVESTPAVYRARFRCPTGGRGTGAGLHRKIPDVGKSNRGDATATPILLWFDELATRMRRVRVVCGDWKRVCTPAVTVGIGTTAVFLDPPYADTANRTANIYSEDDNQVAHRVREWAIENGTNPAFRIALCGYEGEHEMPDRLGALRVASAGRLCESEKERRGIREPEARADLV